MKIDKELLRSAVYDKIGAHEDMSIPEQAQLMRLGGEPEENIREWTKILDVSRKAAVKARELAFEAAFLVLKSHTLMIDAKKELHGPSGIAVLNSKMDEPMGLHKLLLTIGLGNAISSLNMVQRATIAYGKHIYEDECDDCTEFDCPVLLRIKKLTKINID